MLTCAHAPLTVTAPRRIFPQKVPTGMAGGRARTWPATLRPVRRSASLRASWRLRTTQGARRVLTWHAGRGSDRNHEAPGGGARPRGSPAPAWGWAPGDADGGSGRGKRTEGAPGGSARVRSVLLDVLKAKTPKPSLRARSSRLPRPAWSARRLPELTTRRGGQAPAASRLSRLSAEAATLAHPSASSRGWGSCDPDPVSHQPGAWPSSRRLGDPGRGKYAAGTW